MALRALLERGQGIASSPAQLWKRRQWPSGRDGQRRFLAKEAAAAGKTATPNAAKNVKAKNTTKKEEKREQRERFDSLIDACLDAPPPVRALKEKERLRLEEREKLGLAGAQGLQQIQREKKAAKEAKKAAKAAKPDVVAAENARAEEGFTGSEDVEVGHIELTVEEGKRLAKQSSRVLFMESRDRAQGEVVRLKLKKNAIAALPQHLREAALVPDLTPFPKNRIPASLTPPIQGYVEDRAIAAAQAVTVKKTR